MIPYASISHLKIIQNAIGIMKIRSWKFFYVLCIWIMSFYFITSISQPKPQNSMTSNVSGARMAMDCSAGAVLCSGRAIGSGWTTTALEPILDIKFLDGEVYEWMKI